MRPTEWVRKLLDDRELPTVDGRPLYQYRLSDAEFSELEKTLRLASLLGVRHIKAMLGWDAAFVIYAAEWWRRKYSGHWGWEGIFGSIGIDFTELAVGSRNDLIEGGLRRWRRQVRTSTGYRNFLGTIATEGGLPLHQLSDSGSGGWLKRVLVPVLRKHIEKGHSLSALVEAYCDYIPRGYRSAELYQILADIAAAVAELREKYTLAGMESPITFLDKSNPKWREQFPLPIDDASAKSLLTELIDAAAKATVDLGDRVPFECNRYLINAETHEPELVAEMDLPTFVSLQAIGLDASEGNLPPTVDFEVCNSGGKSTTWCRGVLTTFRERVMFKLSGRNFKVKGEDAIGCLKVRIKARGQTLLEFEVPGGELVNTETPWLFKKDEAKWRLHSTATGSVKDSDALIFSPESFDVHVVDDLSAATLMASMFNGGLWKISGTIICTDGIDQFRFNTGKVDTSSMFRLSGQKFTFRSNPVDVFIGPPVLFETNSATGQSSKSYGRRIIAKAVGRASDTCTNISTLSAGVYTVKALDQANNVLFAQTVGVLSREFKYTLAPDLDDVNRGCILLNGIGELEVAVSHEGVTASLEDDEKRCCIKLFASPQPPSSIQVSLLAKNQSSNIVLSFPYPSRGAMLFDAMDKLVPPLKALNLEDIHGHRIKVFNDRAHLAARFALTITLVDRALTRADLKDVFIKIPLNLRGDFNELAVSDWISMVKTLLGLGKTIDAEVRIALSLGSDELLAVNIRRYEHHLTREVSEGLVQVRSQDLREMKNDVLEVTEVLAFNLDCPEAEPITLSSKSSEGVYVGVWEFMPWIREPGPWIIYPSPNSPLKLRPLLWTVARDDLENFSADRQSDSLAAAINVPEEISRRSAIASALRSMAVEFDHSNWRYLDELWHQTTHLPLATFDIWQVAIQEPQFMAALFVKSRTDILERLEDELPVIWELVSKADWELALQEFKSKLERHLSDEPTLIDLSLEQVINRIESHKHSMLSMGKVLQDCVRNKQSPDLKLMCRPVEQFVKPEMVKFYQQLFRRQADQEWPTLMQAELSRRYRSLPTEYRELVEPRNRHHESVVYLPMVLAWQAIVGGDRKWCGTPAQIFKILQIKMFDEDWFNSAFQLLSGWLSQQDFEEWVSNVK